MDNNVGKKSKGRKIGKAVGITALVVIATPVLLLIGYFCFMLFVGPIINDVQAGKEEKQLLAVELPATIEVVASTSTCMNTSGTGNHIEIVVAAILYSEMPLEEVEIHYPDYYCLNTTTENLRYIKIITNQLNLQLYEDVENYFLVMGIEEAATQADIRGH